MGWKKEKESIQIHKGNNKVIFICVFIVLFAIAFVWFRTIISSYFTCFVENSDSAEEALTYNDGLVYTEQETKQLLPLQKSWDNYKQSHLWDETQIDATLDGAKLHAQYHDEGSDITVIYLHRFHQDSDGDFLLGSYLGNQGYNMVLTDARAHGKSEGNYISYGYYEQYDLEDWISWAKTKFGNNTKIIIYGEAMGANTALMAAENGLTDDVDFIIAESPFTSLEDMAEYSLSTWYGLPTAIFIPALEFQLNSSDAGYHKDDTNIMNQISKAKTPAIFLAGSNDDYVPYTYTKEVYNAYQAEKIMISDEVRHSLVNITKESEIENTISQYVKMYCK